MPEHAFSTLISGAKLKKQSFTSRISFFSKFQNIEIMRSPENNKNAENMLRTRQALAIVNRYSKKE